MNHDPNSDNNYNYPEGYYPVPDCPPQQLPQQNYSYQNYPPEKPKPKKSAIGLWGFIFSLLAYLLTLIGGQLLFWPLGLAFSIIGLFKTPKTWAVIGLILSILYLLIVGTIILLAPAIIVAMAPVFIEVLGLLAAALPFLAIIIPALNY